MFVHEPAMVGAARSFVLAVGRRHNPNLRMRRLTRSVATGCIEFPHNHKLAQNNQQAHPKGTVIPRGCVITASTSLCYSGSDRQGSYAVSGAEAQNSHFGNGIASRGQALSLNLPFLLIF